MVSDYEKQRQANIERNKALLVALGLDKPFFEPKETRPVKVAGATKKRKVLESENEPSSDTPPPKVSKTDSGNQDSSGPRRSSRNTNKQINYSAQSFEKHNYESVRSARFSEPGTEPRNRVGKRIHDPKTFGHIPGIEVGTWWESREACSNDAVHAPWVAGISGSVQEGAYSIVISGGYADDVDLGYAFVYTGSGGRDLKGTKTNPKNLRTAPQSSDQTFENSFNKALQRSAETRKPVRVVRGFKLKSKYAPSEGYRYDGLYMVEKAWLETGLNEKGYLVCKFAFKRLPNQPPLAIRDLDENEDEVVDEES